MTKLCVVVLLLLPVSTRAQQDLSGAFGQAQDILKRCRPPRVQAAKPDPLAQAGSTLAEAQAQMRAALGTGNRLLETLDAASGSIVAGPVFSGSEACSLSFLGQAQGRAEKPVINCGPGLAGASPRYAALLLAERIAELRWLGMPDSAEKDFIVASLMSRVWLELGGDKSRLPLFDGRKDEPRSARVRAWLAQKLPDYVRDQRAKGRPGLDDRLDENARAQAGAAKAIRDLENKFKSAVCQSEEQGLFREIAGQKALIEALELEEKNQKRFVELAKSFTNEEGEWALRNWRLLR